MIGSRVIATAGLVSRTVVSRLVFETGIRHLADLNKTPIILKLETAITCTRDGTDSTLKFFERSST